MLRIKSIREAKGLEQIDVAKYSGISQGYLSELENGVKDNPGYLILKRIAEALGVSISELSEDLPAKAAGE